MAKSHANAGSHSFSLMITGGRSAKIIYQKLAERQDSIFFGRDVNIYQTDERCVEPLHEDSNHFMIRNHLFPSLSADNFTFYRMRGEALDLDEASLRYSQLIPESIDILLLSMGEDGHIASLYPNSPALFEADRKVVPVIGPKFPHCRITITPVVIKSAKKVYVLAIGDEKKRKYEEALAHPEDINSIPARLVLDRTWIFDLNEEIDLCPKF